jgi:hypothetical protein
MYTFNASLAKYCKQNTCLQKSIQYSTVQYSTVQYSTVQDSTVQHYQDGEALNLSKAEGTAR